MRPVYSTPTDPLRPANFKLHHYRTTNCSMPHGSTDYSQTMTAFCLDSVCAFLRILREEAPDVEITLMTKSSPELADGLMQGKIDVALLRRETQTAGLAFKFLTKEPLIAILPARHRLARHRAVRPQDLAREGFISTTRVAPVLRTVIDDYAAKEGITLKQNYDAETLSGGMSLVASTGGFTLLPLYVRNALIPSVVARPLRGEVPTIDLMMGYNKSNASPLLKRFLLRADELVNRVFQGEASSRTLKRGDRKPIDKSS